MTYEIACDWALVTPPAEEPISLDEAKSQASIHSNDDNGLIGSYIVAARQAAETYLQRALFTQTWQLQLTDFADIIWLPMAAPLQSVTSVKYYDSAGTLQTLSTSFYTVDTTSEPGRVLRAPNQVWPSTQADRLVVVIITYVCGKSSVADIPEAVKQGIRLHVSASDADRNGGAAESRMTVKAAESCWNVYGQVWWRPPSRWR